MAEPGFSHHRKSRSEKHLKFQVELTLDESTSNSLKKSPTSSNRLRFSPKKSRSHLSVLESATGSEDDRLSPLPNVLRPKHLTRSITVLKNASPAKSDYGGGQRTYSPLPSIKGSLSNHSSPAKFTGSPFQAKAKTHIPDKYSSKPASSRFAVEPPRSQSCPPIFGPDFDAKALSRYLQGSEKVTIDPLLQKQRYCEERLDVEFPMKSAESYHQRACNYRLKGDIDRAMAAYTQAFTTNPNHYKSYVSLGCLLNETEQADTAIKLFRKAIKLAPHNAEAHYNLGNSFLLTNRLSHAISSFTKAIDCDPNQPDYYISRGLAHRKVGDFQSATNDYASGHELRRVRAATPPMELASVDDIFHTQEYEIESKARLLEAAQKPRTERDEMDLIVLWNFLKTVSFTSALPLPVQQALCKVLVHVAVEKGVEVIAAGQVSQNCWIILSGSVEVRKPQRPSERKVAVEHSMRLHIGQTIGESALLDEQQRRSATVTTSEDCHFLILDRKEYLAIISRFRISNVKDKSDFLKQIPLFVTLSHDMLVPLIEVMDIVLYHPEKLILEQGQEVPALFIVLSGQVSLHRKPFVSAVGSADSTHIPEAVRVKLQIERRKKRILDERNRRKGRQTESDKARKAFEHSCMEIDHQLEQVMAEDPPLPKNKAKYGAEVATVGEKQWFGGEAFDHSKARTSALAKSHVELLLLYSSDFHLLGEEVIRRFVSETQTQYLNLKKTLSKKSEWKHYKDTLIQSFNSPIPEPNSPLLAELDNPTPAEPRTPPLAPSVSCTARSNLVSARTGNEWTQAPPTHSP